MSPAVRQDAAARMQRVAARVEVCRSRGHWKRVERLCRASLDLHPEQERCRHLLGVSLYRQRRPREALETLRSLVAANPSHWQAWNDLGSAARALNLWEEAARAYRASLAIHPLQFAPHHNLGNLLHAIDQLDQAAVHYRQAVRLKPDEVGTLVSLAATFRDIEQWGDAEHCLARATELEPRSSGVHLEWGMLHAGKKDLVAARDALRRSVSLKPNVKAWLQLGHVFRALGEREEGLRCYQAAMSLARNHPVLFHHVAHELLRAGEWTLGWRAYEGRFDPSVATMPHRPFSIPRWDGTPKKNARILVWGEQGIGDEVFFLGMVRELSHQGVDCTLECEPRLVTLFARSLPGMDVVGRADPVDARIQGGVFAAHIPSGSLARFSRPSLDSFSRQAPPVLLADPRLVDEFENSDAAKAARFRVGISWRSGNPASGPRRSAKLEQWRPLFQVAGVTWINLQPGAVTEDLEYAQRCLHVTIHDEPSLRRGRDLEALAARIASLDLVVSIDNSTVHFAGGLGVPVWTLLCTHADWRWLTDRTDSPWYPSMRLFRQRRRGDWRELLGRVADVLRETLASREKENAA